VGRSTARVKLRLMEGLRLQAACSLLSCLNCSGSNPVSSQTSKQSLEGSNGVSLNSCFSYEQDTLESAFDGRQKRLPYRNTSVMVAQLCNA
jgi:hypothetical protein